MGHVASRDGTRIAFDRVGTGPPVILVDGALCHRAFGPMGALARELEPHYSVYTYDRRGRGDSGDTRPYAVAREIEDLEALIDSAGGSAFVYGLSSGAALALEAATRVRGVRKLALYEAPFIVDGNAPPRPEDLAARMELLIARNRRHDAVRRFMKTIGTSAIHVLMLRFTPTWSKLVDVAHTIPYDLTILEGTGTGRPLPADRWSAVTAPALVMDGGKSPQWMRHAMAALARVLPDARHLCLDGQTHTLDAKAVAPHLVDFFV